MSRHKPLLRFLIAAFAINALLVLAWPMLGSTYSRIFRAAEEATLGPLCAGAELALLPGRAVDGGLETILRVTYGAGCGSWSGQISCRFMSYLPMALFLALWIATPAGPKRRAISLFLGVGLIFVLASAMTCVCLLSGHVVHLQQCELLSNHNSFLGDRLWSDTLTAVLTMITSEPTLYFVAPVLVWVLVCFGGDFGGRVLALVQPQEAPRASGDAA